jgi:hypothetical protein
MNRTFANHLSANELYTLLYAGVPFNAHQFNVWHYSLFLYQSALKLLTEHEFVLVFVRGQTLMLCGQTGLAL